MWRLASNDVEKKTRGEQQTHVCREEEAEKNRKCWLNSMFVKLGEY